MNRAPVRNRPDAPWPIVPLARLAEVQTGIAKGKPKKNGSTSVPYLRVANVQDGYVDLGEVKRIEVDPAEVERYRLRRGDVLFTEGGDFDKLGRGTVWRGQIDPCLHQNHVFAVRAHEGELLPEFLAYLASSRIGRRYFISCSKQSTNLASINSSQLRQFPIPLPSLPEQRRIVDVLATWDKAIERLSRQVERKNEAFSYLQEALVHGAIRLRRQAKPWPVAALGDVTENLSARNAARFDRNSVMGVTKAEGLVPMKEHVIADNIGRYLIVPPGGFAYNPMRINIGSIAMSEFKEDVLVSPDYVVFACNTRRLLPRFLNHLRRTKAWSDFMTIAGNGSVRVRIYYASLADFEFHLPPLDEQRAIVEILDDAEREIRSLMAEQTALEKQRDALATELLTGRLRVGDVAEATFAR